MPNFLAIYARSSNIAGDLYGLEVGPPDGSKDYYLTAFLSESFRHTVIAEGLARQFGATRKGDQIDLVFRQRSHLSLMVHEFDPIPIQIGRIAASQLGPNYLHLGMDAIESFFDVYRCDNHADPTLHLPMLFLEPLPHYRHWCRQLGA